MGDLDLLDKKILCELDLDARQSASKIAKKLRVSKETVNFRINRLLRRGIIKGFFPLLDTTKIGRFFFKIFIKFHELTSKRKEEVLDFFASYPQMAQVLLLEGKFDVQLFFLAENNSDLMQFLEKMNLFCGKDIKAKETLIVDTLYKFNLKMYSGFDDDRMCQLKGGTGGLHLDPLAQKILRLLSEDARMPVLEIAKQLGVSYQLVQYHLGKLKPLLVNNYVVLDNSKLNLQHYHITLQVNDHGVISGLIEFFKSKGVLFATKTMGYYDCSTEFLAKDNTELRFFVQEMLDLYADKINSVDTMLIYEERKLQLFPI